MAAITTQVIYVEDTGLSKEDSSPYAYKEILVETPDTADSGDTFTVTLANYGITTLKLIEEFRHTTNYSVVVAGTSTTSVTAGVLTVTLTGGAPADNDKRVFIIGGI